MKKCYIGVDIGGGSIKFGVYDQNKKFVKRFDVKTPHNEKNQEKLLTEYMIDTIENKIIPSKYGVTKKNIAGIGFAVPGPVAENNIIRAVNIGWKKKYDLVGAIKKHFGKNIKVVVGNDANMATLGEYAKSFRNKYKSICMFTLGTGVGVGVIVDGKIVEGKHGVAGELSHFRVDFSKDAMKCKCGGVGCLETVTGGKGITNLYNRLNHTTEAKKASDVIRKALAHDKKAYDSLYKSMDYLSYAISAVMLTYEPEIILIGGGVSYEGGIITELLNEQLKNKVFITDKYPKIVLAKLKNAAGMYGCIADL